MPAREQVIPAFAAEIARERGTFGPAQTALANDRRGDKAGGRTCLGQHDRAAIAPAALAVMVDGGKFFAQTRQHFRRDISETQRLGVLAPPLRHNMAEECLSRSADPANFRNRALTRTRVDQT